MIKKVFLLLIIVLVFSTAVFADGASDAVNNYFDNKKEYVDLAGFEWAEDAIYYLSEYGLIEDEKGYVHPQNYISRAEFTKLIIGAFGLYDFDAKCDFEDVDVKSEYYQYIASAYELGIINGTRQGWFGMEEHLLRQDMATIIYRTIQKCGIRLDEKTVLDFADSEEIDGYAKEAVSALVGAKAVSGDENYCFLPKINANFAEACKIIYYIMIKNT